MNIHGPCSICKIRLAKHVCKMCGAKVCDYCYDKITGLCSSCKQGKI